jgi:hypothetical protein
VQILRTLGARFVPDDCRIEKGKGEDRPSQIEDKMVNAVPESIGTAFANELDKSTAVAELLNQERRSSPTLSWRIHCHSSRMQARHFDISVDPEATWPLEVLADSCRPNLRVSALQSVHGIFER